MSDSNPLNPLRDKDNDTFADESLTVPSSPRLPSYEESITPHPAAAAAAVVCTIREDNRIRAGALGLHHSELPNDGTTDPITGMNLSRRFRSEGSLHCYDSDEEESRRREIQSITLKGLDSPYEGFAGMSGVVNLNASDLSLMQFYGMEPNPKVQWQPDGQSGNWGDSAPVDKPLVVSPTPSDDDLLLSTNSLAIKADRETDEIYDKLEGVVIKTTRMKQKGQSGEGREKMSHSESANLDHLGQVVKPDSSEDTENLSFDPEDSEPGPFFLHQRSGSCSTLEGFGSEIVRLDSHCTHFSYTSHSSNNSTKRSSYFQHELKPLRALPIQQLLPPLNLELEAVRDFRHVDSKYTTQESGVSVPSQRDLVCSPTLEQIPHIQGTSLQSLGKEFLNSVRDINSGMDITPGKLVKVKYAYSAKREDEFDLVLDDVFVVLIIASDCWALGSTYGDAIKYISSREQFGGHSKISPSGGGVQVKYSFGSASNSPFLSNRDYFSIVKFFPLEAIQVLQPYEWTFKAHSSTLSMTFTERFSSNFTRPSQVSSYKLHNPPLRGTSKKPGLMDGENKKLIESGYETFISSVCEKISEEATITVHPPPEDILLPPSPISIKSELDSPNSPQLTHTKLYPLTYLSSTAMITSPRDEAYTTPPSSVERVPPIESPTHYQHSSNTSFPNSVELNPRVTVNNKEAISPGTVHGKYDLIPNPTEDLARKPTRKHLLRQWATKGKERLLKSMTQGSRSKLERRSEAQVIGQARGNTSFGTGATFTGNSGQPTAITEDGDLKIGLLVRPSVHTLFTPDINKQFPVPMNIHSGGLGSLSTPFIRTPRESAKITPPKLSINTRTTSPHLWPLQLVDTGEDVQRVSCKLSPQSLKGTKMTGIHGWYRSKFSTTSSNSPVESQTGVKIDECILRGRGVERSHSVVMGEVVKSPTSTRDWAARSLIQKVRKPRVTMERVPSLSMELCRELKNCPEDISGKEN